MSRASYNLFIQLAAAARGDLEAQRALAGAAYDNVAKQGLVAAEARAAGLSVTIPLRDAITLAEGLVFARMAASQGDLADKHRLNAMLSLSTLFMSGEDVAAPLGEMIARISLLADQAADQAELADEYIDLTVANECPEVVALSQEYRRLIAESEAS